MSLDNGLNRCQIKEFVDLTVIDFTGCCNHKLKISKLNCNCLMLWLRFWLDKDNRWAWWLMPCGGEHRKQLSLTPRVSVRVCLCVVHSTMATHHVLCWWGIIRCWWLSLATMDQCWKHFPWTSVFHVAPCSTSPLTSFQPSTGNCCWGACCSQVSGWLSRVSLHRQTEAKAVGGWSGAKLRWKDLVRWSLEMENGTCQ